MPKLARQEIILLLLFFVGLSLPLVLGLSNSFGKQCSDAGFRNAAHEACVKRLVSGGTVYLENMEERP